MCRSDDFPPFEPAAYDHPEDSPTPYTDHAESGRGWCDGSFHAPYAEYVATTPRATLRLVATSDRDARLRVEALGAAVVTLERTGPVRCWRRGPR